MNFLVALLLLAQTENAPQLLERADQAFRARDYGKATELYESAYEAAREDPLAVQAAAGAARGYLIRGKKDEGRPWLAKAEKRASPKAPKAWARLLSVRGRFQWKDDQLAEATKTFEAMYAHCLEHKLHSAAVDAAHMVAITGTPEQQVAWAHKGIEAAEKGELVGWLGPLWNNLGVTWQEKGNWQKALECYTKAREYHWRYGREVNKLAADWAIGLALERLGETEKARQWLRPVLAWAERYHAESPSPQRAEWIGHACRELGYTEMALYEKDKKKERLALADKLLQRAWKHLDAVKMREWDAREWKLLEERRKTLAQWQADAGR